MSSSLESKRVLLTGGSGFLGREVYRALDEFSPADVLVPRSRNYDLREQSAVRRMLRILRPDVIIHLAAVVGGIEANQRNPGRYFYDNAAMGITLMEEARRAGVEKFVAVGTICSYPKFTPVPFREEHIWDGYPEETNAPYGLAKKMLLVQAQAYRQQYGFNAITLLPVNLYGPHDNFDPTSSHVIPALIRKIVEARDTGRDVVEVWGTGSQSREFLFVRDAARGIALAAAHYNKPDPINLGSGQEVTIRELAELICELSNFKGAIRWDTSKPDGQPRRCLDTTRAWNECRFQAQIALRDGLTETIRWWEGMARASQLSDVGPSAGDSSARRLDATGKPRQPSDSDAPRRTIASSHPLASSTPVAPGHQCSPDHSDTRAVSRRALITGISGQDGSYLAELLLAKGYEVHGIVRRSSSITNWRLNDIYEDPHERGRKLILHYGDLTDGNSVTGLILDVEPDEVYNLGAQSHVRVSFDNPSYSVNTGAMGTINVLEAARQLNKRKAIRFYQASSSEMFGGLPGTAPQSETTPFHPRSPYACAKVFSFHQTVNYREAYDLFACNGILFNHESPRRGETFVTRKITRAATRIREGLQDKVYLGNLDARRDWGFAKDYVEAMWLMLQQDEPEDFVIATGETHTVAEFLELSFGHLDLDWHDFVEIDPRYFRPSEVDVLCGDPAKARDKLGWEPATSFAELVQLMVEADWERAKEEVAARSVHRN